jgi:DNA repair exonuclease SbcCD ATPase subunit
VGRNHVVAVVVRWVLERRSTSERSGVSESELRAELDHAEEVYEGLMRTRASLGTLLAEAISRNRDLSEFSRRVEDLPHLIREADTKRTELRVKLLTHRLQKIEEEQRRATNNAKRAAAALEAAEKAHAEAVSIERRLAREAQRLASQRNEEAERLEGLQAQEAGQEEEEGSGVSETPTFEDVIHALRVRLAGSPQLRDQPAEDIAHDLMTNGYLPTEPDPALVRRALAQIGDNDGGAV